MPSECKVAKIDDAFHLGCKLGATKKYMILFPLVAKFMYFFWNGFLVALNIPSLQVPSTVGFTKTDLRKTLRASMSGVSRP